MKKTTYREAMTPPPVLARQMRQGGGCVRVDDDAVAGRK